MKFNDSSKLFLISDHHFSHDRIRILGSGRPYEDVESMNQDMIQKWNSVVKGGDTVIHCGDFSFGGVEEWSRIRKQLNSEIVLIRGNHDKLQTGQISHLFSSIHDYLELKVRDDDAEQGWQKIVCFHYPIASFNGKSHNSFHAYGHIHKNELAMEPFLGRAVNLCVENHNYTPVSYQRFKELILAKNVL